MNLLLGVITKFKPFTKYWSEGKVPVLLFVRSPELEVDPEVEYHERDEGYDARDNELIPPRAESDVVRLLVHRSWLVHQDRGGAVGTAGRTLFQVELEKLGDVESTCAQKSSYYIKVLLGFSFFLPKPQLVHVGDGGKEEKELLQCCVCCSQNRKGGKIASPNLPLFLDQNRRHCKCRGLENYLNNWTSATWV